jgi:hypothetical protein
VGFFKAKGFDVGEVKKPKAVLGRPKKVDKVKLTADKPKVVRKSMPKGMRQPRI